MHSLYSARPQFASIAYVIETTLINGAANTCNDARRVMMHRFHDRSHDLDSVSTWVLTLLVIPGLMIAAIAALQNTGDVEAKETQLHAALPADHAETVRALMSATGHRCDRVCAVGLRADTTLTVSCGSGDLEQACAAPREYTLTINDAARPSR